MLDLDGVHLCVNCLFHLDTVAYIVSDAPGWQVDAGTACEECGTLGGMRWAVYNAV